MRAKADRLSNQAKSLQEKADEADKAWSKINKQSYELGQSFSKANDDFDKAKDKYNSSKTSKDILANYHKQTDQESKILFQHNLNEGKRARQGLLKAEEDRINKIDSLTRQREAQEKVIDLFAYGN